MFSSQVLSIIEAAGWTIWLIIAASVLAMAIIIERFYSLRRAAVLPRTLLNETIDRVKCHQLDNNTQLEMLSKSSPLGQLLAAGIRKQGTGRDRLKEVMEEEGQVVSYRLERFLSMLGTIAAVSPLLGLLGTVIGMIEIFGSQGPEGSDPRALAHGISIALYNTAMGLIVAIPSMIFYRYFRAKVDGLLVNLEIQASLFVDFLVQQEIAAGSGKDDK